MSRSRRLLPAALALALVAVQGLPAAAGEKGAGTEHRKWVNGAKAAPVSPPVYAITEHEQFVAVRDGVRLQTRIFLPVLPQGAKTPPCVLETDGYGTLLDPFFMPALQDLAKRGYAVMFARLRGTPPSEGVNGLYERYGEDGYDLIEWMADQPWCNGDVGMVGGSLLGISQWLAAKEAPPHLRTFIPDVACGDCYSYLWYLGGMLPGGGRKARAGVPGAENEYANAIQHRNFDAYWRERTTMPEDVRRIARREIPVLIRDAWGDYLLAGAVRNYENYKGVGNRRKIILGSVSHAPAPDSMPYTNVEYQVMWLDRWLKGIRNGIDKEPRALIYVQGPNQWRFESDWPIPDTHPVKLYLRGRLSGSAVSLNDGALSARPPRWGEDAVSYTYSPGGPFNQANGNGPILAVDQRPNELHSLTWTSEPLSVPTEATGWWSLDFWASVNAPDTDFVVEITDVAPDGSSTQVGRGWLNAARAFSRSNPKPLKEGRVYNFAVEVWPTSYVFPAGHRMRVALSGSDCCVLGSDPNPVPGRVTVHQDIFHPSHLEVPVIGGLAASKLRGGRGHGHGWFDDDD
jgi:predicted acyl esterase